MSATPNNHYSRRDILQMALAAAAVSATPGLALAQTASAGDAQFAALMADFAEEILILEPSSATQLGLDSGKRSALKSKLENNSPSGDAQWTKQVKSMQTRMAALDQKKLSPNAQIRYDTLWYATGEGIDGTRFSYGGAASGFNGGTSPYPVTQQNGAILSVPEFLDSQHQIANVADAESYLARVAELARVLDEESARITEQASKGIMPPSFIAHTALGQLNDYRKTPVAQQKLVTSLV